MKRKSLPLLLTLCVILSMLPMAVFAQDSETPPEDATVKNSGPVINLCGAQIDKRAEATDKPDVFKITLEAIVPNKFASALAMVLADEDIQEDDNMEYIALAVKAAEGRPVAAVIDPMSEFVTLNRDSLPEGMAPLQGEKASWWKLDQSGQGDIGTHTYTLEYYVTVRTEFCDGKFHPTNSPTVLVLPPKEPCEAPITIYFPIPEVKVNQVKVSYTDGVEDEEVFADQLFDVNYGADTPAFAGNLTRAGYLFAGWEPEVAEKATEDVTYIAQWDPRTDTAYRVAHYRQNLKDDGYTLCETEDKEGTTDGMTEAKAREYPGFTAKDFEQAKIAADGSTVVEILYDRNEYTITYTIDGKEYGKQTYKFESPVTPPKYEVPEKHEFSGWNTPKTMPAKDLVLDATLKEALLQTGQLNWPIPVLSALGILLLAIGLYVVIKKRKLK